METDQYIGVDLHQGVFSSVRDHRQRRATMGRAIYADGRGHHAVRRPVWGTGRRGGRSDDADLAFRRSDRRACRERLRRRYAEDQTQSRVRGEDGSTRCASPGGCAQARKRGQHLHPVPGDPRAARIVPASPARHPDAHTGVATDARLAVAAGTRRSAGQAITEPGGPGLARSTPAANPGAPRVNHDATTGPRSEHPARAGECRHRPRGAGRSDRAAAPTRPRDRPSARFDAPRRDRRHRPVPDPRPFWRVTRGWCPRSTAAPRVRATAASRKTARPGSAGLWSRWACRPYAGAIPWVGGAASSRCAKA